MFEAKPIVRGIALAFGGLAMAGVFALPAQAQQQSSDTQALERVEVTGSGIRRADAESSLPVTVITREQIESSGANTVAELMRTSTFASAGNFRPQSGSSAQSLSTVDLRGLGARRTLVLLDGRRLPKAPMIGDSVDMNIIPLAAVERIEILSDGASAVYGSDAIGGVVNIITRKNFEGLEFMLGASNPITKGGSREEMSAVYGVSSEKGRIVAGFGRTEREMVYTRERPWGSELGVTTYGNNYRVINADDSLGPVTALPGGCSDPGFWITESGSCSYNYNSVAADEAQLTNSSLFARGEININADWQAFVSASVSRVESFGRYAPTPGVVVIPASASQNPTGGASDVALYHRFAAAGNRDTSTENNLYDALAGVVGRIGTVDIEAGLRSSESKYTELGRGYIVGSLAEQAIVAGDYNIYNPTSTSEDVLNSIQATINREAYFKQKDAYAKATFDLFRLEGGVSRLLVGADYRKEEYSDQYDSLQEAGVILGSAGNSAGGDRNVKSGVLELLLPVTKTLEFDLAGRYEKYSDYGSDFAPKASVKWQPIRSLALRGSVGKGFAAPSLPILTQRDQFSAESVHDPVTCQVFGGTAAACNAPSSSVQVDTYYIANPELKSEDSTQYSFGAVWDATSWASLKADFWHTKIEDTITQVTAQDIIDRDNGDDPRAIPSGLGIVRNADGSILSVTAGYANEGVLKASGIDWGALFHYKTPFGAFSHNLQVSHVLKYEVDGSELKGTLGLPKLRASLQNAWRYAWTNVAWNVNLIGSNYDDKEAYVGTYVTHDLALDVLPPFSKGTKLTVGLVNAFDKRPTLVSYDGRNFNFYLYDSYGRTPYIRLTHKF